MFNSIILIHLWPINNKLKHFDHIVLSQSYANYLKLESLFFFKPQIERETKRDRQRQRQNGRE